MVFTEVKERNGKKYYYRVESVRDGNNVRKKRKYLGVNLSKKELALAEKKADRQLLFLNSLLADEELDLLNYIKKDFAKEPKENFENRYEAFCSLFTYDSTSIEGNTLTLQETARLLFEEMAPPSKPLREINEILNHKKAFDYLLQYKGDITKDFMCKLHKLVVKNTLKPELGSQVGKYRGIQVYIRGVRWTPPKAHDVPKDMKSLLFWYSINKNKLHPLVLAAYFHSGFEIVHPFVDGNGRVGRLLINFILHKNKYPMVNIPNSIKHRYYSVLEEAQVKDNLRPLVKFLFGLLKKEKIRF